MINEKYIEQEKERVRLEMWEEGKSLKDRQDAETQIDIELRAEMNKQEKTK